MESIIKRMKREYAYRSKIQEMLNRRYQRNGAVPKWTLTFYAEHFNRQYPQYAGHWNSDEWQVKVLGRNIRTKLGQAFRAGDVVLVNYQDWYYTTAYSIRNNCDTAI